MFAEGILLLRCGSPDQGYPIEQCETTNLAGKP